MNKIIAGMLFMVFAGSAIAAQPVLSPEKGKPLQELREISNRSAVVRSFEIYDPRNPDFTHKKYRGKPVG